ncbi:hypothetical protein EX30DRAFT_338229 [Ascodesmis nigricans]|uniref:Uncharacterized protein n=1 Tax=Ascodesmis nigricans TaxID=341454 RepID=A0A4S2N3U3_9PEZI|nr:hypothetical protein EX30DRAFT_338229 [Ascodesmis nigricans]
MSTRVYANARVRNAVYVYHGYNLVNSSTGSSTTVSSASVTLRTNPLAPKTDPTDPTCSRKRPLTTSTANPSPQPAYDESVYQATEAARVSRWLARFSPDAGMSGIKVDQKPGLQVHMRPPVFDKKVFEATEALQGEEEVRKVRSEKKGEGFKLNKEDIKPVKHAEKKSWEEMLKEPVYDPRYPLNASTATGHEANRSGVEPNTMEEVGTMNAASEVALEVPVSTHPTGYPAKTKMARDKEVLEATEDLEGSRKIRVYSGSGDKRKIKLDKVKVPKPETVTGTRDPNVFLATEEISNSKKLDKFTPAMKARSTEAEGPKESVHETVQENVQEAVADEAKAGDVVFRATEVLAREHPLPGPSPPAASDTLVLEATERAAATQVVEKHTPGEQPQQLQPKPANFDMLPATKIRRPLSRQFFGTTFSDPARDATVLMATEALGGARSKSSSSVPRQILEDPNIAIDHKVLEATEKLADKTRPDPAKLPKVENVPPEDELIASLDEPVTSGGFRPNEAAAAAAQNTAKPPKDTHKSHYTSWNPPAPPSSSLSDPSHQPFRRRTAPVKEKEEYYGGFESAYDRNSLSDPFLYTPRPKVTPSPKPGATKPPAIIPDQILQEARARLVKAYNANVSSGKTPNIDELLATAAGSNTATASEQNAEFVIKTPKGDLKIMRLGEELDGFKLVVAETEAVEELKKEAKEDTAKEKRRKVFWSVVWVSGAAAGLTLLAEEGRKVAATGAVRS